MLRDAAETKSEAESRFIHRTMVQVAGYSGDKVGSRAKVHSLKTVRVAGYIRSKVGKVARVHTWEGSLGSRYTAGSKDEVGAELSQGR